MIGQLVAAVVGIFVFIVGAGISAMIRNEYAEWARPLAALLVKLVGVLNPGFRDEWLAELLYMHKEEDKHGLVFALSLVVGIPLLWFHTAHDTLFAVHPQPSAPRTQLVLKRAFDVAASILFLAVTLPFLAATAAAVAITSRGPVFYQVTYVGKEEERFGALRFRTMSMGADTPRITSLGRLLRATSVDELPQLVNVLTGKMSFVGPRPVMPQELVKRFGDDATQRSQVKPGITCTWQLTDDLGPDDWINKDLEYINQWTFWTDMQIILKTIFVTARRLGSDLRQMISSD